MRTSLALTIVLVGCGGGGSLTDNEGVYTLATWTDNTGSCDAEGPSVLDIQEPNVFIKNENFLGSVFVNVNPCPDLATCQAEASDDETIHIGNWAFETGSDSGGWASESAFAFSFDGECQATRLVATLTFSGDSLRIEDRRQEGTFPADANDECSDAEAETATVGQPCIGLEVVTATFTADF